jgi:hypothetical protein
MMRFDKATNTMKDGTTMIMIAANMAAQLRYQASAAVPGVGAQVLDRPAARDRAVPIVEATIPE